MSYKILVVDDDAGVRRPLAAYLMRSGYAVCEAASARAGVERFERERPDVVLLDHALPDGNSLELLPHWKSNRPDVPIFVLTGYGSIELAVDAVKLGAEHFLTKPLEFRSLVRLLDETLARRAAAAEPARGGAAAHGQAEALDPFVGASAAIRTLAEDTRLALVSDSPVLIHGPTGAGKGVLARFIHEQGTRRQGRLVALNCGALSSELLQSELFGHARGAFTGAVRDKRGLFELADGGTLFLDEIGDLDLQVQPKLLTVLEDKAFRRVGGLKLRRVDARFISASNQDLPALVEQGRFRSDLYYRLTTLVLRVPPLRDRREDIPAIARSVLARLAREDGEQQPAEIDAEAIDRLAAHDWPGNIRELRNVLERALMASGGDTIRAEHIRIDGPAGSLHDPVGGTLEQVEREHIERALRYERGHVTRTARRLGVARSTLYERLREFGIDPDEFRR